MSEVNITITPGGVDVERIVAALAAYRQKIAKHDSPQAKTARKARQRRRWHKVVFP